MKILRIFVLVSVLAGVANCATFVNRNGLRLRRPGSTVLLLRDPREARRTLNLYLVGIAEELPTNRIDNVLPTEVMHDEAIDVLSAINENRPRPAPAVYRTMSISTAFKTIAKLSEKFQVVEGRLCFRGGRYQGLIFARTDEIYGLVNRALDRITHLGLSASSTHQIVNNIAQNEGYFVKAELIEVLFENFHIPPDSPLASATPSRTGPTSRTGPFGPFRSHATLATPTSMRREGSRRRLLTAERRQLSQRELDHLGKEHERTNNRISNALTSIQAVMENMAKVGQESVRGIKSVTEDQARDYANFRDRAFFGRTFSSESIYRNRRSNHDGSPSSPARERAHSTNSTNHNGYYDGSFPTTDEDYEDYDHHDDVDDSNHDDVDDSNHDDVDDSTEEAYTDYPTTGRVHAPGRDEEHATVTAIRSDERPNPAIRRGMAGRVHAPGEEHATATAIRSERPNPAIRRGMAGRVHAPGRDEEHATATAIRPNPAIRRGMAGRVHAPGRDEEHATATAIRPNPAIRRGIASSEYASLPPSSELSEDTPTDRPHPDYHFASRLQEEENWLAGPRFTGTNPSATADADGDDDEEDSKPKAVPLPQRPVPPPATQPLPSLSSTSAVQPPATNFARDSTSAVQPPPATDVASSPPPPSRASFGANSATTETTEARILSSAGPPGSAVPPALGANGTPTADTLPSEVPQTVPLPTSATEPSTSATVDSFPSDPPDSYFNEDDVEDVQDVLKFCLHTVQEKGGEEEDAELMAQEKKTWECGKCGHSNAGDGAFCTNEILDKDGKPKRCYGCKKHEGSPKGWAGCFKGVRGKFFLFLNFMF
jgi:hypothetical protein